MPPAPPSEISSPGYNAVRIRKILDLMSVSDQIRDSGGEDEGKQQSQADKSARLNEVEDKIKSLIDEMNNDQVVEYLVELANDADKRILQKKDELTACKMPKHLLSERPACDECKQRRRRCMHRAAPVDKRSGKRSVACDDCKKRHNRCEHVEELIDTSASCDGPFASSPPASQVASGSPEKTQGMEGGAPMYHYYTRRSTKAKEPIQYQPQSIAVTVAKAKEPTKYRPQPAAVTVAKATPTKATRSSPLSSPPSSPSTHLYSTPPAQLPSSSSAGHAFPPFPSESARSLPHFYTGTTIALENIMSDHKDDPELSLLQLIKELDDNAPTVKDGVHQVILRGNKWVYRVLRELVAENEDEEEDQNDEWIDEDSDEQMDEDSNEG
ncbi:hypothetical protein Ptr902_05512 [Pyrenophora tritici-repentis]|nr:hypothetical protein Ptr902_05512 [Pyrenophora tritici-repentis]